MEEGQIVTVDNSRMCWVCFATDEEDPDASWVKPCLCRGTSMWVHQNCLQRWIDEKQKGNSAAKVACPKCNTEYIIIFPRMGGFVLILHLVNHARIVISPYMVGMMMVGSVYWCAASYGALTIVQVLGMEEGKKVLEEFDFLLLALGLPMIPVGLIIGTMNVTRWEDWVLQQWRRHWSKLPIFNKLFPNTTTMRRIPAEQQQANSDILSITRVLCDGLLLPTVVTVVGKVFFQNITSNKERILVGGVAFLAVKGFLKLYYRQSQYVRQAARVVCDYVDPNMKPDQPGQSTSTL